LTPASRVKAQIEHMFSGPLLPKADLALMSTRHVASSISPWGDGEANF
jgi:hypothetical protein